MSNSALVTINGFPLSLSSITVNSGATVNVALSCSYDVIAWTFACTSSDPVALPKTQLELI